MKQRKATQRGIMVVGGTQVVAGSLNDWRSLVATFVADQDVKPSSRELYKRTLTQFVKWVEIAGKHLDTMERGDLLEYKDSLSSKGLSSLTIGSYIVVLRKFYGWTAAHGLYRNISEGLKAPRRVQAFKKQHLTDSKSTELLEHFRGIGLRDYAIVNLILRSGLRTIEVVRADVSDVTFKGERRILKVWGKGHNEKDDYIVLTDKAWEPIKNYLATRPNARSNEPLFVSYSRQNAGQRLTTRTISGIVKDGLKAIGLDGREFTAHSLRHTAAVAILKHGGSITDVQEVLRHNSPTTSQIYVESVKEELRLAKCPESLIDEAF